MSTKKPAAPTAPNELTLLRARAKALETDLAFVSGERDKLRAAHEQLLAELRRRGSGLPIVARLIDVVLEMHRKDTSGRSILVGVAKLVDEMRQFNGTDELPGKDAAAMESVDRVAPAAARSMHEALRHFGAGAKVPA